MQWVEDAVQFGIMSLVRPGMRVIQVELEFLVFLRTGKKRKNGAKDYLTI